jgi:16S rRNA (cytosine967-C5)-methyltransferase
MNPLRIFKAQLETAASLYKEIAASPYPADREIGNFFHRQRKRYGSKDRKVISEAVYGAFRHQSLIGAWVAEMKFASAFFEVLCGLVCDGLAEQEIFKELLEAREAGFLWRGLRAKQLPPAFSGLGGEASLALRYSFPVWLVSRWSLRFGAGQIERVLAAMNERPPLTLRANPLKTSREELIRLLKAKGHEAASSEMSPWAVKVRERFNIFEMEEFRNGFFEVQDEGSQLVALALAPEPGELVWDACSGGGGKTLLLAALMRNKGRVVATDIRLKKLMEVKKRAKRAGIFNIFPADLNRLDESSFIRSGVDRLLIDAPCSGSGTLRRNPDAKWKLTEEKLLACQADQLGILNTYTSHLNKGGRLVYATCSLEPEENEDVVGKFLETHPAFTREAPDRYLYPHEHGTDGFFISTLRRD